MKKQFLLVVILYQVQVFAQFSEQLRLSSPVRFPYSNMSGDIDLDGDIDLAATSGDKLYWYENLGDNTFALEQLIGSHPGIKSVFLSDLDLDGDQDFLLTACNLFSVSTIEDYVLWIENTGSGTFGPVVYISQQHEAKRAVYAMAADLDGDGDPDIISASEKDNKIAWHENLGGGSFGVQVVLTDTAYLAKEVFTADLDNDGDLDILSASFNDDKIAWFENLGGSFGPMQIISTTCDGAMAVVAGDLDGDLDIDVVSCSYNSDKIIWFENTGGGLFSSEQIISSTILKPQTLALFDVDYDLDLDVISGSRGDSKIAWHENSGGGVFVVEHVLSDSSLRPESVRTGDFNSDGLMDIVSASYQFHGHEWFQNMGGGVFATSYNLSTSVAQNYGVCAIDLDNDGALEALSVSYSENSVGWYHNKGEHFNTQRLITNSLLGASDVMGADIDNDGDNDVVACGSSANTIIWYENSGSASFIAEHIVDQTFLSPRVIFTIDIDLDLDIDILVGGTGDEVALYENLGGGVFAPKIVLGTPNDVHGIHAADLDNDGDIDVVATSYIDDEVIWYENLSGLTFGSGTVISSSSSNALRVYADDMDGDGDNDIIIASNLAGIPNYFENLGAGNFAPVVFPGIDGTNTALSSISSVDINDDGLNDILATSGTAFIWRENLGNGSFALAQVINDIPFDMSGRDSWAEDMDSDGDQDVLCAAVSGEVLLFENLFYNPKQIRGTIFIDYNENGMRDSNDVGMLLSQVTTNPFNGFSYTYATGKYILNFVDAPNALYTIEPDILDNWYITTDSMAYHVLIDSSFTFVDSLDFGFFPDTLIHEVNTELIGGYAKCNTTPKYWINIQNTGTIIPSGIVQLTLDSNVAFLGSIPSADSVVFNTIYWSFSDIYYFNSSLIEVQVQMPSVLDIGDTMVSYVQAQVVDTNGVVAYISSDSLSQVLVCAYDPNDKNSEPIGADSLGYVPMNTFTLDYTVRFQNTGTATATDVLIKDQLDANLDWESLQYLASSDTVEISVNATGEITFLFDNIMLPDSNSNEPASHGFIKYRIDLLPGLSEGTSVYNTANIYFDENEAIITNTKINTLLCFPAYTYFPSSEICFEDSLSIFGDYVSDAGVYYDTLQNSYGCDSILVQSITEFPEVLITDLGSNTICEGDSILFFSSYLKDAGIYNHTLQNINGCDSVVSMQMQLNALPLVYINPPGFDSICLYSGNFLLSGLPVGGVFSGNGISSDHFEPSIAGIGNHTVFYEFTDTDGCKGKDSVLIYVDACLGIKESNKGGLSIYPNPASNFVRINFGNIIQSSYYIHIYNLLGEVVYSGQCISMQEIEINLADFVTGSYYISIGNENMTEILRSILVVD